MNLHKRASYALAAPLFLVASVALQLINVVPTYAATLTWTGNGDGVSFSDTSNWSTGSVPVNGDVLTFDVTGLTADTTLDNDLSGLSVAGITFVGSASNTYNLDGNSLTLTGDILNLAPGQVAVQPSVLNDVTLGANASISKVNIGEYWTAGDTDLNLAGHALTVSGDTECGTAFNANLSGSGSLYITGSKVNIRGDNANFTGPISVTGGASFRPAAFGATSAGTVVSGDGEIMISTGENVSIAEPLTLGGNGKIWADVLAHYSCGGGMAPTGIITLVGGVTLMRDYMLTGRGTLVIDEPYTSNGHSFTVQSGATATLTLPTGTVEATPETIELNGDTAEDVNIGFNQTAILNGSRGYTNVGSGAVLKGTGRTTTLSVNGGGVVAPGNSPGAITALNTLNLYGTYTAELQNKNTYDQLIVGENYSYSGGNAVTIGAQAVLDLSLFDGWAINQGDTFTIIDNKSTTDVSGTFSGLEEGAQIAIDGITFSISYVGGDGNDVVLTALNTGTDPTPPNTGVAQFVQANPAIVAVLGMASAAALLTIAIRRRSTQ